MKYDQEKVRKYFNQGSWVRIFPFASPVHFPDEDQILSFVARIVDIYTTSIGIYHINGVFEMVSYNFISDMKPMKDDEVMLLMLEGVIANDAR